MSTRLRRVTARWLIHLARRLHPIRTLTDLRAINRMDSALNPEKARPIEHRTHEAFSYHLNRYGDFHRSVEDVRCGRCGQAYRKPAVGSWCCSSPRPHITVSNPYR